MSNFLDTEKTIVAISTPIGAGGISIVRMSGKNAINIADLLFRSMRGVKPSGFDNNKLVLGRFNGKYAVDKCFCVVFRAPNSFSGENMVEFQCHGGIKITELILKDCLNCGAQIAQNGEFSMRAFVNGKMTLSEAEGMIDMINAQSESEITAGYSLMSGQLTKKIDIYQKEIIDVLSEIEVSFDYPEEDIEYTTIPVVKKRLILLNQKLSELINTSSTGAIIKNGINAVIVGKPNVGKSSILNALINKNKAIVTNIAGTTRDIIEDAFEINGIKVNIVDTAGIHETHDMIEKIGVEKSIDQLKTADIVLFVIDNTQKFSKEDSSIYEKIKEKKHIVICNKIDKQTKYNYTSFDENMLFVSAKNGNNIQQIKQKIYDMVIDSNIISSNIIITNERHNECLKRAKKSIEAAISNIENVTLDLVSIDITDAFSALGEITGTTSNEVILDSVFSKFCLGK